jgi:hypothetical protein
VASAAPVADPGPVDLPPAVVPFAVRAVTEVRPDLWPLARPVPDHVDDPGPRTLVRLDAEVPVLVAGARHAVATDPGPWTAHAKDLDPDRTAAAGLTLARAVAAVTPSLLTVTGDRIRIGDVGVEVAADGEVSGPASTGGDARRVVDRLRSVPAAHRSLEAVALAVAEDIVLVAGDGRAVWLHVCAPSGWDPGASGGRSLLELHGPVPTADRLHAASRALARAIVATGPHVRWVWGLTDDPRAAMHPGQARSEVPAPRPIGELTFRAERQTTLPLPELDLGVFLIRVHRAPLGEVVADPDRRDRLAAAVRALPPDLAVYKGVADRRDELLDRLTADTGGVRE